MSGTANPWGSFAVGTTVELPFTVTDADMDAFLALSGDDSASHTDLEFCHAHGLRDRVVYGGLLVAVLSRVLGTRLPGRYGLSNSWTINFHNPLSTDEPAVLRAEVTQASESMRVLKIEYHITAGDRLIAEGTALSSVLDPRPAGAEEPA